MKKTNTILYYENWISTVAFYRDVLQLSVSHEVHWMVEFQLLETLLSKRARVERQG